MIAETCRTEVTSPIFTAAFAAGMVSLIALGLVACQGPDRAGDEAEHAEGAADESEHAEGILEMTPEKLSELDLETAEAAPRPFAAELATTGQVDFEQARVAHVSPRIPGRVQRVAAELGDRVRSGQTLAVLDSVELGQARAAYAAARVREDLARETYERERTLYEDRISSQREMLEAKAAYQEAASERQSVEETLRLYGVGAGERGPRSPGGSLLPVRSPIAGEVVEKHVTLGELVAPEDNLFTVADLGHVWIWIDVFEGDLAAVHLGDDVEVRVDAFPAQVFAGEVTYLAPQVSAETRAVRARIDVANPEGRLRPGMFARVRLSDPHGGATDALSIPASAVVRRGDEAIVFVPAGPSSFEVREIELGRREGEWVEVLSGLEPGTPVVTTGSFFLKSELAREELGGGHGH